MPDEVCQPPAGGAAPSVESLRATARATRDQRWESITLELETITPVYGGGTEPGKPDLMLPFRPRAIKNALRHWWWVLFRHDDRYAKQGGDERLYSDMVAIWGGPSTDTAAARANVRISTSTRTTDAGQRALPYSAWTVSRTRTEDGYVIQPDNTAPWAYALFGARGERAKNPVLGPTPRALATRRQGSPKTFTEYCGDPLSRALASNDYAALFKEDAGSFRQPQWLLPPQIEWQLSLALSTVLSQEQCRQVRLALAFWTTFGGVGARTPRGLGRSRVTNTEFEPWKLVLSQFEKGAHQKPKGVTVLFPAQTAPGVQSAESAMLWLLDAYRSMRQQRNPGDGNRPGRSHWPKADVVRRLRDDTWHKHRPEHLEDWLPEMLFGAPIIVDYGPSARVNGDPDKKTELVFKFNGEVRERFASPCLFGVREQPGGHWLPYLLILNWRQDLLRFRPSAVARDASDTTRRGGRWEREVAFGAWWPDMEPADTYSQRAGTVMQKFPKLAPGSAQSPLALFGLRVQGQKRRQP